jgi:hypothetical protein
MMLTTIPRRTPNRCVVCDTPGDFPYDARFDGAACDVCHAMLTIRDDVFRRLHPEHEEAIRAIWRDLHDPDRARAVGSLYSQIGYFDDQEQDSNAELDGPDDRIRRLLQQPYEALATDDED